MKQIQSLATRFGRRLRELRTSRGLTQEQLGKQARIDYKHLGAIERGAHTPSFEAIERLSRTLKVDYAAFFGPTGSATGDAEEQLKSLIGGVNQLDPESIELFLRDLLAALRKLQRASPENGDSVSLSRSGLRLPKSL